MAIPGVPNLDPVSLPQISASEAGRAGGSVEGLGELSQSLSLSGLDLQAKIRKAQGTVDRMAANNQLDALWTDYQSDLNKATDSRDIEELKNHWQSQLNDFSNRWGKSPDAVQIDLMADSYRNPMEHAAQERTIKLQGMEWDANWTLQQQSLLPSYIQAVRNGATQQASDILNHINSTWDEAIQDHLKWPAEKTVGINAFQIAARKGLNEAAIESPNPVERQKAIDQLRNGGSGPLDLTNSSPGDINALLDHAEEANKRLTALQESNDVNGALNRLANVEANPEFQGVEGRDRLSTLLRTDPDWVAKNGFLSADGKPDMVMADKMAAKVEGDRQVLKRQQDDKDQDGILKFGALIDDGKLRTNGQIDGLAQREGLSSPATSKLKSYLHTVQNEAHDRWVRDKQLNDYERAQQKRDDLENSANRRAQLELEMASGSFYEPSDIMTMTGMTQTDKRALIQEMKDPQEHIGLNNPYINAGLASIKQLVPDQSDQVKMERIFVDKVKSSNAQGNQIDSVFKEVMKDSKNGQAKKWIDDAFRGIQTTPAILRSPVPVGATMKVPGKDGKLHWTNDKGTVDFGVVQ